MSIIVRQSPATRPDARALPRIFDGHAVQEHGPGLRELASDPAGSELRLDGHDVEHVSTRALGLLVALQRLSSARGGTTRIVDPSVALTRAITFAGLADRLLA